VSRRVDNPFWAFSQALYGREGVAPACLALQERFDLDVNLLLFCCWAGSRGRTLSRAQLERAVETVRPWRDAAVRPLRAARRWLKFQTLADGALSEPLRQRIKAGELEAEAIQQEILFQAVAIAEGRAAPAAVAANMVAYLGVLGRRPTTADIADLAAVLGACCPALAPLDAVRFLDG